MSCHCCHCCNCNDDDHGGYTAPTRDDVVQFLADSDGDDWVEILADAVRQKERAAEDKARWQRHLREDFTIGRTVLLTVPIESSENRDKRLKKEGAERMTRVRAHLGIPDPK